MPQIKARYLKKTAAGRQKAAKHAKSSRLARPVRTQQTENFAPSHRERYVIHGGKITKFAYQVAYFDNDFVGIAFSFNFRAMSRLQHCGIQRLKIVLFAQQYHKPIFQTCLDRRHRRAVKQGIQALLIHLVTTNETDGSPLWNRIDDAPGVVQQANLHDTRRLVRRRRCHITQVEGVLANVAGCSFSEQFAFMQHKHPGAAFGFIEVGSADQYGQSLVVDHLPHNFPQFPA